MSHPSSSLRRWTSRSQQPEVDYAALSSLPRTTSEIVAEVLAPLITLAGVAYSLAAWGRLPAQVPTHFDLSGKVDGYGSRNSFLLLPVVSVALWALLTVTARFPRFFNYPFRMTAEEVPDQYRLARWFLSWLKVSMALIFSLMQFVIVQMAVQPAGGGPWMAWLLAVTALSVTSCLGLTAVYLVRAGVLRQRALKARTQSASALGEDRAPRRGFGA